MMLMYNPIAEVDIRNNIQRMSVCVADVDIRNIFF